MFLFTVDNYIINNNSNDKFIFHINLSKGIYSN